MSYPAPFMPLGARNGGITNAVIPTDWKEWRNLRVNQIPRLRSASLGMTTNIFSKEFSCLTRHEERQKTTLIESQSKHFVAKILIFENRNAAYILVCEYRKHKKSKFAAQKTKIGKGNRPPKGAVSSTRSDEVVLKAGY